MRDAGRVGQLNRVLFTRRARLIAATGNCPAVGRGADIVAAMQGLLIDGPSAGQVVDAGDPPVRRAVVVPREQGFGELANRYYLESVEFDQAIYRCAGEVEWPPEARSEMVRRFSDQRQPYADVTATGARLNGD